MAIHPTKQLLERAIRTIIAEGSDLGSRNVIPASQSAPSPTETYATLLEVNIRPRGLPELIYASANLLNNLNDVVTDVAETVSLQQLLRGARSALSEYPPDRTKDEALQVMEARYNIQWVGSESADKARLFYSWCDSGIGIESWERAGITFLRQDFLRNIPTLITEHWEDRYMTDILISYQQSITFEFDVAGNIEIIPFRVVFDDGDEQSFEVNENGEITRL